MPISPALLFSGFAIFLATLLSSCSTPSPSLRPRREAFPELQRHIEQQENTGHQVIYPRLRKAKIPDLPDTDNNGHVWAVMKVGPRGTVEEVRLVGEAPAEHRQAISKALTHWCYSPGRIDGKPATFPMQVQLALKPRDKSQIPYLKNCTPPKLPRGVDNQYTRAHAQWQSYIKRGLPVQGPKIVKFVRPRMPEAFLKNQFAHVIVGILLVINEQGSVDGVYVYGDRSEEFRPAIEEALRLSVFKPALVHGKPHTSTVQTAVNFVVFPSENSMVTLTN